MKKIIEHLRSEWYKYLLEIVVLIIGIYGAFALDNWNEERKERDFEVDILRQIKKGVAKDIIDLEYNLRVQQKSIVSQTKILGWLKSDAPYTDTMCSDFARVNSFTSFISSDEAFETLKSVGMTKISNDSLKNVLVHLHENTYDYYNALEEKYKDWQLFKMQNIDHELFEGSFALSDDPNYEGCQRPTDIVALRTSVPYQYHLNNLLEYNKIFVGIMQRAIDEGNELNRIIDKELE